MAGVPEENHAPRNLALRFQLSAFQYFSFPPNGSTLGHHAKPTMRPKPGINPWFHIVSKAIIPPMAQEPSANTAGRVP
jgi:hypothetical protein